MTKTAINLYHLVQEYGQKVVTFNRAEFEAEYRRPAETLRMLQYRLESALEPFNILVSFGLNAVIVASDSNFAPVPMPGVCHCKIGPPGAALWNCPLHGEVSQASVEFDQTSKVE